MAIRVRPRGDSTYRAMSRLASRIVSRYGQRAASNAASATARAAANFFTSPSQNRRIEDRFVYRRRPAKTATSPGGTRMTVSSRSQHMSRSAGKLRKRRYRLRKRDRIGAGGIAHTLEVGKTEVTQGQTIWVGHTVCPTVTAFECLWRLILKKLMVKTNISIRDFSYPADNITTGDIISVVYQNADGTQVPVSHTVTGGQTWNTIVGTFSANTTLRGAGCQLKYIEYIPTINTVGNGTDRAPARLNLEFAYVSVYMKSSMKIQNQTVFDSNNAGDAESTDNTPLYGRIYAGNGTGVSQMIGPATGVTQQLIGNANTGYIVGVVTDLGQQEPVAPYYFPGCKLSGKVKLDPGDVKTHVLVYKKDMHVNTLRKLIGDSLVSGQAKTRSSFGKFGFFGIERMLQCKDPSTLVGPNIKLGLEINHYIAMNMKVKFRDVTAQGFTATFL